MASGIKEKHLQEIIKRLLKEERLTRKKVWRIVKTMSKKYGLEDMPTNVQLLDICNEEERQKLTPYLQTKPARTASGVAIVTVVPEAAKCPGDCVYCPIGEDSPKSYTGTEPAIMRARHNKYDPFLQVRNRLNQYNLMGHPTDKVQMIIIGGTFLALDKKYKTNFIKRIFDALNNKTSNTLEEAKKLNETANNRCIGLIIETRPDFCKRSHIDEMLGYGTTMVEIGVQSVYPEILKKVNRMHTIQDVIEATQLSKNAGLKVNYHVMPGLPGASLAMDIKQFKLLFENPDFKPDALKIYPTLVVKGTKLYKWWESGSYSPLTTEDTITLLAEAMNHIPEYCRIVRMQRTMSVSDIEAGVKKSNLREFVETEAERKGIRIREIRYREAGRSKKVDYENAKLCRMDYDASKGREIFLSFEDKKNDVLIGFLRLRIPSTGSKLFRSEINGKTAVVRELHVYGPLVRIGKEKEDAYQHKGFGAKLLAEAERIANDDFDKDKLVITSGVGVREYYYRNNYKIDGAYVSKILN